MENQNSLYKIISIFTDNADISIDEEMDYDKALERFKELKIMETEGSDTPNGGFNCFVFLIRGEIIKTNKKS